MAADVPLLSSYKRPFVGRRLFHTFTGIKVLRGKPPAYVYAVQVREIQKRDYRNKARLKKTPTDANHASENSMVQLFE